MYYLRNVGFLGHPETLAHSLHLHDTNLFPIGQTVFDFSATAIMADGGYRRGGTGDASLVSQFLGGFYHVRFD
jgi:hypothetical protein